MGKVRRINKARKLYICTKCGRNINKGDIYFRGELNDGNDIIRCSYCGLEYWEVSSSEYIRNINYLKQNFTKSYDTTSLECFNAIIDYLRSIRAQLKSNIRLSGDGRSYQKYLTRIDDIDATIDELEIVRQSMQNDDMHDSSTIVELIDEALLNLES